MPSLAVPTHHVNSRVRIRVERRLLSVHSRHYAESSPGCVRRVKLPDLNVGAGDIPAIGVGDQRGEDLADAASGGRSEYPQKCLRIRDLWSDEELVVSRPEDQLVEVDQGLSAVTRELRLDLP